jgi:hypothetical protein
MRNLGKRGATAAAIAVLATVAGCGGVGGGSGPGGGEGSCTLSESVPGSGPALVICEEATGLSPAAVEQLRQTCMLPTGSVPDAGVEAGAHFSYGPCSHVGAVGGCRVTTGAMTETIWYYAAGAGAPGAAEIQTLCAQAGATFVPA